MDRLVITIRPTASDEALLSVADAMQQVLDFIKLSGDAQQALGNPHESFEWKLEKASTNSPFTIVAVAEAADPAVDISGAVKRIKHEVSRGIQSLLRSDIPPAWMTPETFETARSLFARNLNGIGETDIDFEDGDVISIDRGQARAGIDAIEARNVMVFEQVATPRTSFGEIEGVMVAAGRYKKRPALQIRNEMYGFVWCILPDNITEQFGGEHSMGDVWEGKTLGVYGRLNYATIGKLTTIDVQEIREIESAPRINLEAVLDPDFTAGMDPLEYLEKLHEGRLG